MNATHSLRRCQRNCLGRPWLLGSPSSLLRAARGERRASLIARRFNRRRGDQRDGAPAHRGPDPQSHPHRAAGSSRARQVNALAAVVRPARSSSAFSESWMYSAPVWRVARTHGPARQGLRRMCDQFVSAATDCIRRCSTIARTQRGGAGQQRHRHHVPSRALFPAGRVDIPAAAPLDGSIRRLRKTTHRIVRRIRNPRRRLERPADGDDLLRPFSAAYQRGARFNITVIGAGDPFGGAPLRTAGTSKSAGSRTCRAATFARSPRRRVSVAATRGLYSGSVSKPRSRISCIRRSAGDHRRRLPLHSPRTHRFSLSGRRRRAFASALCWVADHRHEAADIGSSGRRPGLGQFDYGYGERF